MIIFYFLLRNGLIHQAERNTPPPIHYQPFHRHYCYWYCYNMIVAYGFLNNFFVFLGEIFLISLWNFLYFLVKFVGSSGEIFWISQSVGGWVSDLEIAIASPSFASLFYVSLSNALLCGSHDLSAWGAWRTKSSRHEEPKAVLKGRQLLVDNNIVSNV